MYPIFWKIYLDSRGEERRDASITTPSYPGPRGVPYSKKNQDVHVHLKRQAFVTWLALACCVLVLWTASGLFLYVHPQVDQPTRSQAVVILAPVTKVRLAYAEALMSDGYADTLAISVSEPGSDISAAELCQPNRPYRIICFTPEPETTRGEARAIQRLSTEQNWGTINVVTNVSHVSRARIIINRCYTHRLHMLAAQEEATLIWWGYRFVYESAAFVKASSEAGC